MDIATYPEWRKSMIDALMHDTGGVIDCPHCTDRLKHVICPLCKGIGTIKYQQADPVVQMMIFTREEYIADVISSIQRWAEITGQDAIEQLYTNGLEPWQSLPDKTLRFNPVITANAMRFADTDPEARYIQQDY